MSNFSSGCFYSCWFHTWTLLWYDYVNDVHKKIIKAYNYHLNVAMPVVFRGKELNLLLKLKDVNKNHTKPVIILKFCHNFWQQLQGKIMKRFDFFGQRKKWGFRSCVHCHLVLFRHVYFFMYVWYHITWSDTGVYIFQKVSISSLPSLPHR